MARIENEFVVDTRGNCFLCLNQINQIPEQFKTTHSIQYLSKYLKLDMTKVFQGPVPLHLLKKVERSNLKVELCLGCSTLNNKLTEMFEQLERIQMEITFKLNTISEKINFSEESGEMNRIRNTFKNCNSDLNVEDLLGKLEIAQVLREETHKKCSNQLFKAIPKARIEKTEWRKPSIKNTENNEQETFGNILKTNIKIKMENSPCPSFDDNIDNNDSMDSDMIQPDDDYEISSSVSSLDFCKLSDTVTVKKDVQRKKFAKIMSKNTSLPKVPPPIQSGWNAKLDAGGIADKRVINPENGNHQCRICNKEYSQYCNFFTHFKTAHMKVNYTCPAPDCGKSYGRKEHYENHYQSLHLKIRYRCKICRKTFSHKNNLSTHLKNTHQ